MSRKIMSFMNCSTDPTWHIYLSNAYREKRKDLHLQDSYCKLAGVLGTLYPVFH